MWESTRMHGLAEQLISHLNGVQSPSIVDMFDRSFTIHAGLLSSGIGTKLASLSDACRQQFAQVKFDLTEVTTWEHGFTVSCIATLSGGMHHSHIVTSPCTCKVQCKPNGKLHKMWFKMDQYEIVRQLRGLCSEPGHSAREDHTNKAAIDRITAVLKRRSSAPISERDFLLHASIELFKNLDIGIETELWHLEGVGQFEDLLALIHARFSDPIDISLGQEIAQGFTSTFRGHLRGRVGNAHQRYTLCLGVRSGIDSVNECWVKVAPPLTLRECLS